MRTTFAWLGGVLFVASLHFFLYTYLVTFGETPPPGDARPPGPALVMNIVLFAVFATHHSLLARPRFKAWIARIVPPELERSTYVWTASALFLLTCWAWARTGRDVYDADSVAAGLLTAVQALGVLLVVMTIRRLDHLEIAGIRQLQTRERHRDTALQTTGVYSLVRHPLYLGWILFVFAVPSMTLDRLYFASISTAYLLLAIPWEERSLVREFGREYDAYRQTVRWRVLPGLY